MNDKCRGMEESPTWITLAEKAELSYYFTPAYFILAFKIIQLSKFLTRIE